MQAQPTTSRRELISVITASSVGTLIEWYDFYIFGTLATIISTQFFPKDNPTASFLATLATFAAGLLVRPFGALVFGRLGDLVGRKYTFMITMVIMGGSTFTIGLIPTYDTIGFWAPLLVLILRLLQGLAIGGEYGGAATFVAEHSPDHQRGYWTSWIQTTVVIGFITSLAVIILTQQVMSKAAWEAWGWRIPFLASVILLIVSVWIRRKMRESPLYARAKSEGRTSSNPLQESFGNRANFKLVLLALFGLTMGVACSGWASVLYAQTFIIKTMHVEYNQANKIVMIGICLGALFMIFFGWLSDRIGRKPIIMASLLLTIFCFRPIYDKMYKTADLRLKKGNFGKDARQIQWDTTSLPNSAILLTSTTRRSYEDGTISEEINKQIVKNRMTERTERMQTTILSGSAFRILIFLVFLLAFFNSMAYGTVAAFMVEMFPLRIRYSSLSLPYHVGYGIFGGTSQVLSTYLIEKAHDAHRDDYYLAGLAYPIAIISVCFVIGLLYLKENGNSFLDSAIGPGRLNNLKKWLGIFWILLGLAAGYFGIIQLGIPKISSGNQEDLIFGIIVMFIMTPITSIGLITFGRYALSGDYKT